MVSATGYQNARRTTDGIDLNKLQLLLAVLEKRAGLPMGSSDAFVKVTGGVKIDEPAVDLGLAVALASSYCDCPVDPHTIIIGEVGLTGEVRGVSQIEQRIRESHKMGFHRAVVPLNACRKLDMDFELTGVRSLVEALRAVGIGKRS